MSNLNPIDNVPDNLLGPGGATLRVGHYPDILKCSQAAAFLSHCKEEELVPSTTTNCSLENQIKTVIQTVHTKLTMCQLSCRQVVMSSCWHLRLYKLFDTALLYLRPDGDVVDEVVVLHVPRIDRHHPLPRLPAEDSHYDQSSHIKY